MNILKESGQQLKVQHEYLMMTRTHALTTIAQSPTSIEYRFKILYLALLPITAVGRHFKHWGKQRKTDGYRAYGFSKKIL